MNPGYQEEDRSRVAGIYGSASKCHDQQEVLILFIFNEKKVKIKETCDEGHCQ